MESKIALSIIVPVYNASDYIERCVDSVTCEPSKSIEVVLIDDGSTDDSGSKAIRLSNCDKRVRVVRQNNKGVSAARNRGIAEARGEYLMFLDADDYLCEGYFKELSRWLNRKYDFVGWANYTNRGNSQFLDLFPMQREEACDISSVRRMLMCTRFLHTCWAKIHRRDVVVKNGIKFPEGVSVGEDYLFEMEYFKYAHSAALVNRPILHYFIHENSAMTTFQWEKRLCSWKFLFSYCSRYIEKQQIGGRSDFAIYQFRCLTSLICDLCFNEPTLAKRLQGLHEVVQLDEVDELLASIDCSQLSFMKRFEYRLIALHTVALLLVYFSLKARVREH